MAISSLSSGDMDSILLSGLLLIMVNLWHQFMKAQDWHSLCNLIIRLHKFQFTIKALRSSSATLLPLTRVSLTSGMPQSLMTQSILLWSRCMSNCCVILIWTMIQMDSVRFVLHKHVDKPSFRCISTPQSQTLSSTEVRSTLHMFPIHTYTL